MALSNLDSRKSSHPRNKLAVTRGRGHWLKNRIAFEAAEQLEANDRCIRACIEPSITHLVVPLLTQPQQMKPSRPRNMDLYKTALCDYWAAGMSCRFGDRCWFAHGPEELRVAQFVLPGPRANPTNNPFDYEIRMGEHWSLGSDGSRRSMIEEEVLGFSPNEVHWPSDRATSRVIGSERMSRLRNSTIDTHSFTAESLSNMRRPASAAGNVSSTDDIRSPRCSDSGMGASWYSFTSTRRSEDIHEMNGNCDQMEKQHEDEYNLWSGTDIELNFLPDILPRDVLS
uniref:C3H1-type domain-containing protein n=1 Tax=Parascaris univalens TaxID=6257 RepID=A0A914ZW02_PARUN